MQLHPLRLGKPPKPQMSEAAAPPPEPASLQSLRKAAIPPSAYEDVLKQQARSLSLAFPVQFNLPGIYDCTQAKVSSQWQSGGILLK